MVKDKRLGVSLIRSCSEMTGKYIRETIDNMKKRGLTDAGYDYLNIGDLWMDTARDENGKIRPDASIFENGFDGTVRYAAENGIKLGTLTSAGTRTIHGRPGSFDREYLDAETLYGMGFRYFNHDFIYIPARFDKTILARRMGHAARIQGGDFVYAAFCDTDDFEIRAASTGADIYSVKTFSGNDSVCEPPVKTYGFSADSCLYYCGDIVVGKETSVRDIKRQLVISAMNSSPCNIDCKVEELTDEQISVLTNGDLIGILTDREVRPARKIGEGITAKFLENDRYAVALVNDSDEDRELTFYTYDFGISVTSGLKCEMTECYTKDRYTVEDSLTLTVPAKDSFVFTVDII